MRFRCLTPALAVLTLFALGGCSYVHFGRQPGPTTTIVGDEKLLRDNTDLRLEKKMLQQELALTRAQGDALRFAIENRTADGDTSKRLVDKLTETNRELTTLRANYAKLQTERSTQPGATPAELATLKTRLGETEEKLAGSLRNYTQLQDEIGRLRTEVDQTRTENTTLAAQVKTVTAQNEQAQAALAQLNTELLAQKESRTRIEQDAATLRTQLDTANTRISTLAQQRTAPAADARGLAAPGDAAADTADLRGQLETLRKKVWSLEGERTALQQQVAALETAAKSPGLAEATAHAETKAKLAESLSSAKMLRDENDQLKTVVANSTKTRADLEAELAKAKATAPLVAQAQGLREQFAQAQAQAAALVDENTRLKARLALSGSNPGTGAAALNTATPTAPSGVTATFVANVPLTVTPVAGSSASAGKSKPAGGALRFHTVSGGDTLSRISTLYYGTPGRWAEILVANRDVLGEDNNLVIGRTLRIP